VFGKNHIIMYIYFFLGKSGRERTRSMDCGVSELLTFGSNCRVTVNFMEPDPDLKFLNNPIFRRKMIQQFPASYRVLLNHTMILYLQFPDKFKNLSEFKYFIYKSLPLVMGLRGTKKRSRAMDVILRDFLQFPNRFDEGKVNACRGKRAAILQLYHSIVFHGGKISYHDLHALSALFFLCQNSTMKSTEVLDIIKKRNNEEEGKQERFEGGYFNSKRFHDGIPNLFRSPIGNLGVLFSPSVKSPTYWDEYITLISSAISQRESYL